MSLPQDAEWVNGSFTLGCGNAGPGKGNVVGIGKDKKSGKDEPSSRRRHAKPQAQGRGGVLSEDELADIIDVPTGRRRSDPGVDRSDRAAMDAKIVDDAYQAAKDKREEKEGKEC